MGTRSTTQIVEQYNDGDAILVNMYRQYDGYPEGHGQELVDFLNSKTIVNGFSNGMTMETHANGAGCLAAQVVDHFKQELGGIYLVPHGQTEQYNYKVIIPQHGKPQSIRIVVTDWEDKVLFDGNIEDYNLKETE